MEQPSGNDSTTGATAAPQEDIGKYLDDERPLTQPEAASRLPDPATQRSPTPELDFHHEAWERLREAGVCLRAFLQDEPRAIDLLTDFEEQIVKQTVGRSVLDRAAREAGRLYTAERQAESAAKPRVPYPTVSVQEFDLLGKTPGYPGE
jgi:hypothetical protein